MKRRALPAAPTPNKRLKKKTLNLFDVLQTADLFQTIYAYIAGSLCDVWSLRSCCRAATKVIPESEWKKMLHFFLQQNILDLWDFSTLQWKMFCEILQQHHLYLSGSTVLWCAFTPKTITWKPQDIDLFTVYQPHRSLDFYKKLLIKIADLCLSGIEYELVEISTFEKADLHYKYQLALNRNIDYKYQLVPDKKFNYKYQLALVAPMKKNEKIAEKYMNLVILKEDVKFPPRFDLTVMCNYFDGRKWYLLYSDQNEEQYYYYTTKFLSDEQPITSMSTTSYIYFRMSQYYQHEKKIVCPP